MKQYITVICISVLLFMSKKSYTQQLPIYSQYMFNDYLINSAYAGTYAFTPIILNHRTQWVGFGDSAPQTSSISMHGRMGETSALGGSMLYDKTSPISNTQMELSYVYHAILNERARLGLSMALGGTFSMKQFTSEIGATHSEMTNGAIDIVNQENDSQSVGDVNFGIILFNDYFDIGLSIRNLLAPEHVDPSITDEINRVKYLLIHGTYLGRRDQSSPFALVPSFVLRKMGLITYNELFEADFNLKMVYRNKIWTGISYRTHEKAISTLIGFNTPTVFLGWSYDIGTSQLGAYHNGSHNIAIGLKIGKNKRPIRNQNPFKLNVDESKRKLNLKLSDMRHKSGI